MEEMLRTIILEVIEASLSAQLKAIRRLRRQPQVREPKEQKILSNTEMGHNILASIDLPMHVTELIARIEKCFGVRVDRDSLVSAISKKIGNEEKFRRTDKNTFAIRR